MDLDRTLRGRAYGETPPRTPIPRLISIDDLRRSTPPSAAAASLPADHRVHRPRYCKHLVAKALGEPIAAEVVVVDDGPPLIPVAAEGPHPLEALAAEKAVMDEEALSFLVTEEVAEAALREIKRQERRRRGPAGLFSCNECLEVAMEPVVTPCGHLFCWPCLFRTIRDGVGSGCCSGPCVVCGSQVDIGAEGNVIPIYGRGVDDPRRAQGRDGDSLPSRPRARRKERPRAQLGLPPGLPEWLAQEPTPELLESIQRRFGENAGRLRQLGRVMERSIVQHTEPESTSGAEVLIEEIGDGARGSLQLGSGDGEQEATALPSLRVGRTRRRPSTNRRSGEADGSDLPPRRRRLF